MTEIAISICGHCHHFTLVFQMAERTRNRRSVRLMDISSCMAFQARLIDSRRRGGVGGGQFLQIQDARIGVQCGGHHSIRARVAGDVAGAAALVQVVRFRQRRECRAGVRLRNFAGTDETIPPRRAAEYDQKQGAGRGDDCNRQPSA